jgi:hypothetical protein
MLEPYNYNTGHNSFHNGLSVPFPLHGRVCASRGHMVQPRYPNGVHRQPPLVVRPQVIYTTSIVVGCDPTLWVIAPVTN